MLGVYVSVILLLVMVVRRRGAAKLRRAAKTESRRLNAVKSAKETKSRLKAEFETAARSVEVGPALPLDPLAPRYDSGWFDQKNRQLEQLRIRQSAKARMIGRYAILVTVGDFFLVGVMGQSPLPGAEAVAVVAGTFSMFLPVMWIFAWWQRHSTQTQEPVMLEIERAQLREKVAEAGRASRNAGQPSGNGMAAWQSYSSLLVRWHDYKSASIVFTPDHPFWTDPTRPALDELWSRSIADPNAFASCAQKLHTASRRRHDAWLSELPRSDPQTYMAIEQLRHQRRMEYEARSAAQYAADAAASAAATAEQAAITARNTSAIAKNTANTANSTAAIVRGVELERRRREYG